jgi:hypothetical protein
MGENRNPGQKSLEVSSRARGGDTETPESGAREEMLQDLRVGGKRQKQNQVSAGGQTSPT